MAKLSPFAFVADITHGKQDIYDEQTANAYIPFIVNRSLSNFVDTVLYANDINMYPLLDNYIQYQYFLNSIPKRQRFSKWAKKIDDAEIKCIMELQQCNFNRAEEIHALLSKEQLQELQRIYAGISNDRPRSK